MSDIPAGEPGGDPAQTAATRVFTGHRQLLFSVVYNMLGSVADTEDVRQETWLAWVARAEAASSEQDHQPARLPGADRGQPRAGPSGEHQPPPGGPHRPSHLGRSGLLSAGRFAGRLDTPPVARAVEPVHAAAARPDPGSAGRARSCG